MSSFLTLPQRRFTPLRYRPGNLGTWSGHLPFANDLVAALRPRVLVELGTHYGESYFGLCQAALTSGAECRCFAVDTWRGDDHAGFYGDEVFEEVNAYNQENYRSFSTLIRCSFDEAAAQFAPESIDLLHIDGLHTYAAVKHDFETWFPKVKPGGIVLLHDITVRHADFEVWRLWEELSARYPHFEFRHCWGLGMIQKPVSAGSNPEFLQLIFQADRNAADLIRDQYSEAAELLEYRERSPKTQQPAADSDKPYLQVFPGIRPGGFLETESLISNLEGGVWQHHVFRLPKGAPAGLIRIDPVNRPACIELAMIAIRDVHSRALLELSRKHLAGVYCDDQLMALPPDDSAPFFSSGNDPQWLIPLPAGIESESPLHLEISMRVSFNLEAVRTLLLAAARAPDTAQAKIAALQEQIRRLQSARAVSAVQRNREQAGRNNIESERNDWQARANALEQGLAHSGIRLAERDRTIVKLQSLVDSAAVRETELRAVLAGKDAAILDLQNLAVTCQAHAEAMSASLSWRITTPLRAILGTFSRK